MVFNYNKMGINFPLKQTPGNKRLISFFVKDVKNSIFSGKITHWAKRLNWKSLEFDTKRFRSKKPLSSQMTEATFKLSYGFHFNNQN